MASRIRITQVVVVEEADEARSKGTGSVGLSTSHFLLPSVPPPRTNRRQTLCDAIYYGRRARSRFGTSPVSLSLGNTAVVSVTSNTSDSRWPKHMAKGGKKKQNYLFLVPPRMTHFKANKDVRDSDIKHDCSRAHVSHFYQLFRDHKSQLWRWCFTSFKNASQGCCQLAFSTLKKSQALFQAHKGFACFCRCHEVYQNRYSTS